MRIERHLFGSVSGYTTLGASPGLTADDCRLLESGAYGFGQTDVADYLRSLDTRPAFFTRVLPGQRRGLTRIFQGKPDDNGRPTLLMITAVFAEREFQVTLGNDVGLLLNSQPVWAMGRAAAIETLEVSFAAPRTSIDPAAVASLLTAISAVEMSQGRGVVTSEHDLTLDAVIALDMLIPSAIRPRFTIGYRSLSPQLSVSINVVADVQAGAHRLDARKPLSWYAEALVKAGIRSGHLPLDLAETYFYFGQNPYVAESSSPAVRFVPPPPPKRRRRWRVVLLIITLLLLCAAAGTAVWIGLNPASTPVTQPAVPGDDEPALQDPTTNPAPAPTTMPALVPSTTPATTRALVSEPATPTTTASALPMTVDDSVPPDIDVKTPSDEEAAKLRAQIAEKLAAATQPKAIALTPEQEVDLLKDFEQALNRCDSMIGKMKGKQNVLNAEREAIINTFMDADRRVGEAGLQARRDETLKKPQQTWYANNKGLMQQLAALMAQCDELEKRVALCQGRGPEKVSDTLRQQLTKELKAKDVVAMEEAIRKIKTDIHSSSPLSFVRGTKVLSQAKALKD